MSDDMMDDFRALKAHRQEGKNRRYEENSAWFAANMPTAQIDTTGKVARIEHRIGVIIYYLTTNRWQHLGKVRTGTPADFARWLGKRER